MPGSLIPHWRLEFHKTIQSSQERPFPALPALKE
jgi:hypothetical protein